MEELMLTGSRECKEHTFHMTEIATPSAVAITIAEDRSRLLPIIPICSPSLCGGKYPPSLT